MKIIVDSNIIVSSLISKNSRDRDFILFSGEEFVTSKFGVIEVFKYKEKIARCSQLTDEMVLNYYYKILEKITLMNEELISKKNYKEAFNLCEDIDKKDILFVALTIELNGLLWTGDKNLIEGLESKGFSNIFNLTENK